VSFRIPIGPYHPALEEPYKLELLCDGETVRDAVMNIGFNFRGIEYLAERRNYLQGITLVERVCGICSNVHSLSYCQAVEQLTGAEPPERALYIRVILAELERLHSHFLWSGVAAKLIGFKTIFMTCFTLRERVMDALSTISGNRVNYGMNCIGGVNRDIADPQAVLNILDELEREIGHTILPIFLHDRSVEARCKGVGILTTEQARAMGAVGPLARASGIGQDMRKAAPYAPTTALSSACRWRPPATCARAWWFTRWRWSRAAAFCARRCARCLRGQSARKPPRRGASKCPRARPSAALKRRVARCSTRSPPMARIFPRACACAHPHS
jgi:Ni,Fe-hydrogenase III large subunit